MIHSTFCSHICDLKNKQTRKTDTNPLNAEEEIPPNFRSALNPRVFRGSGRAAASLCPHPGELIAAASTHVASKWAQPPAVVLFPSTKLPDQRNKNVFLIPTVTPEEHGWSPGGIRLRASTGGHSQAARRPVDSGEQRPPSTIDNQVRSPHCREDTKEKQNCFQFLLFWGLSFYSAFS